MFPGQIPPQDSIGLLARGRRVQVSGSDGRTGELPMFDLRNRECMLRQVIQKYVSSLRQ